MKPRADLFSLDSYPKLIVHYVRKASAPGASYTIRQAARCFWSLSLQYEGEVVSHAALKEAGIALPDWLADCPPAGELIKQQRAAKSARQNIQKAAA
jgi:hypothetical protein